MVEQFNEEKVNKYFYRLRKAFVQNNKEKSQEYLSHLKYHVMVGGDDNKTINEQIGEKLGKISELITNINTETNLKLVDFKKQIADKENELVLLREDLKKNTVDLELAIQEKAKLSDALKQASEQTQKAETTAKDLGDKYTAELDELKKRLSVSDATIEKTSKSILDNSEEMTKKDSEITTLRQRVEVLTTSNESEKQAKEVEIAKLTGLKQSIGDILKVLAQNMTVALTQVASLEKSNQDLVNNVAASAAKITELDNQVKTATAEKQAAIAERDQAKISMETISKDRLTQLDGIIGQLRGVLVPIKTGHPLKEKVVEMIGEYKAMQGESPEKKTKKNELQNILKAYEEEKTNSDDKSFGNDIIKQLKEAIEATP
jgi:chromosome segregation ATPase